MDKITNFENVQLKQPFCGIKIIPKFKKETPQYICLIASQIFSQFQNLLFAYISPYLRIKTVLCPFL